MANIDERASWYVERIMPTVGILVLLSLLNPLEDLEEGLEFNLTIGKADVLEAFVISLFPTLLLNRNENNGLARGSEDDVIGLGDAHSNSICDGSVVWQSS